MSKFGAREHCDMGRSGADGAGLASWGEVDRWAWLLRAYLGTMARPLPPLHLLLAFVVVAVWGTNFVVIRWGLDDFPPLTFAALRFVFAVLPAVFFLKRPAVSWWTLAAYGALIGVGQFGVLYIAMTQWISPGLASLVIQTQAFFTIGFAMLLAGERIRGFQVAALVLAGAGLAWLMAHADASATPLGLAVTISVERLPPVE